MKNGRTGAVVKRNAFSEKIKGFVFRARARNVLEHLVSIFKFFCLFVK